MAAAQQLAAALMGVGTNVVLLENMLDAATIRNADERQEVGRWGLCNTLTAASHHTQLLLIHCQSGHLLGPLVSHCRVHLSRACGRRSALLPTHTCVCVSLPGV